MDAKVNNPLASVENSSIPASPNASSPVLLDRNIALQNIPAVCILIIITTMGLFGNTLVIVAVHLSRRLQTTTNIFVITLSCTDLLNALTLPFQVAALLGAEDAHSAFSVVCGVIGALAYIFNGWSISTLIAIAFNRYCLITKSMQKYRKMFCRRNIIIMLSIVLAYPIVFVALFTITGWATFGPKHDICSLIRGIVFNIISGVSMVTLMIAILYFYLKIYVHVRNHVRRTNNIREPSVKIQTLTAGEGETKAEKLKEMKDHHRQTESKITQNMLFVVLCFFICMLPITVILFKPDINPTVEVYCFVTLSLNCCLNPVIYAWKHPVFRQVFGCMISCRFRDVEEPSRWLRERLSTRD